MNKLNKNFKIIVSILLLILLNTGSSAETNISLSATDQVNKSINKINELDGIYNAVISLNPNLSEITRKLDQLPVDQKALKPLFGMPILLKDNVEMIELPTTAGSLALKDNMTNRDAPLVANLRKAGAVILGKSNLSEWANFRSEKSLSGWSAIGGQTVNAHDVLRSPCGSSSGSAVAVAKGYVNVAIGTETHGSIICPASMNGVVGFKPTQGLISGKGIVPISSSQDTAGPIANTIENAANALAVMVDADNIQSSEIANGLFNLMNSNIELENLRVGVFASNSGFDKRRDDLLEEAKLLLTKNGAILIDGLKYKAPDDFWANNYQLLQYEFKRDLNEYLASLPNRYNELTLAKIIEFNKENADQEMPHFGQEILIKSQEIALTEKAYLKILKDGKNNAGKKGLDKLFAKHKLDVIIGISQGPAWMIDNINGDVFIGPSGPSGFPAVAGHPHVTIPIGKIEHMPIGLSFIAPRWQDHKLAEIVLSFTRANK